MAYNLAANRVAGLDLTGYCRPVPARKSLRTGSFWLVGAVWVLLLLALLPAPERASDRQSAPLQISLQPGLTDSLEAPAPVESKMTAPPPAQTALAEVPAPSSAPTAQASPALDLSRTRAQLLEHYYAERLDTPIETGRERVMDRRMRAQLDAIAAAQPAADEAVSTLPDAMGQTKVRIGDHCFVTSDLDNQALRGMKNWWVGMCGNKNKPAVSLKGVKLKGAR